MTQQWFIAKYVRDPRRREPRNVGIVLFSGETVLSRFLAEKAAGIDGRTARHEVASTDNYRAWVHYWRTAASSVPRERLIAHDSTDNYYLEHGGRLVAGPEIAAEVLLEKLYAELVADVPLAASELKRLRRGSPRDQALRGRIGRKRQHPSRG